MLCVFKIGMLLLEISIRKIIAKLPIPRVELFIPYHFVLGILAQ